ncbi:MAG: esterase-like activity of phytase family protein [Thermoleophilia bacterium]|nr:esterase-like activity of phytase family protein [Thermoleophilia bacterium]
MRPKILLLALLATAAAAVAVTSSAAPDRARLVARAILPAATFASGPPSGQFIGAGPFNGVAVPFATQPVQGFSAVLPAEEGSFWVMPDNGYGAKANSSDFLLRVYHVTPHFRTAFSNAAHGGDGTVTVGDFIQLRDPGGKVPFPLTRPDRLLTGPDFDIESIRKVKDGTLWFGDEFGPFLLHTDATGEVLDAPIQTPGVQAPENPFRVLPANLPSSGGYEGMALAGNGNTLFPMLEKAVAGDDPQVRRIYSFDVRTQTFDDERFLYRLDPGSVSIGDFTQLGGHRFVVIERDNGQGTAAQIKRIYEVDLHKVNPDGTLVKTLAVDLMNIADPAGISLPGRPGDIGLGATFTFPYVTIEDVLPLGDDRLLVINDNNFPFSTGRNPSLPDYDDFIVVQSEALDDEG